jgi:hypothetical protein
MATAAEAMRGPIEGTVVALRQKTSTRAATTDALA